MTQDKLYFQHIRDSIERIEKYTFEISYGVFSLDDMRVGAVLRELSIIGEAANQMADSDRMRLPSIPWPEMISMRNRIIHEYFGVDLEIVWRTIQDDIPVLKARVEEILKTLEG